MEDEEALWRDVTRKRGCWAKVKRSLTPAQQAGLIAPNSLTAILATALPHS
jgi:hypothetical protein